MKASWRYWGWRNGSRERRKRCQLFRITVWVGMLSGLLWLPSSIQVAWVIVWVCDCLVCFDYQVPVAWIIVWVCVLSGLSWQPSTNCLNHCVGLHIFSALLWLPSSSCLDHFVFVYCQRSVVITKFQLLGSFCVCVLSVVCCDYEFTINGSDVGHENSSWGGPVWLTRCRNPVTNMAWVYVLSAACYDD